MTKRISLGLAIMLLSGGAFADYKLKLDWKTREKELLDLC